MITVEDADAYFAPLLSEHAWNTCQEKGRTLATAAAILKPFYFTDPDHVDIKHACAEIALAIHQGVAVERDVTTDRVGSITVIRDPAHMPEHIRFGIPSAAAWALMLPHLRDPNTLTLERV